MLVNKPKTVIFCILAGVLSYFISPYETKLTLSVIFSVEALVLWGSSAVDNAAVSLFFIAGAWLFSLAPLKILFTFPKTENFYLIILSYILTKGVTDTGAAAVFSKNIQKYYGKNCKISC